MAEEARAAGWPVESLDYQGIADPRQRVRILVEWCGRQAAPPVLVGSSMGGYVALAAAAETEVRGLLLLAPALYVPGFKEILPSTAPGCPVTLIHGWRDDVIPWEDSVQFAAVHQSRLLLVDGDHRLSANLAEIRMVLARLLAELEPASP
jgi:pimeloyl-ACP methyl ester carboxylesterase